MLRAAVVFAVVLSSCAAATTSGVDPDHLTASPVAASSYPASDRPAPSPTATAVTPSATPPAPTPVAEPIGSVSADFDCDGSSDLLEFYALRPGTYESLYAGKLARLTRSSGTFVEVAFGGMPFDGDAEHSPLLGVVDVNGDGCDDAIINVGHGASTVWVSFLVFDGTELRRVEEDGNPVTFLFGGSVRHGNAIECLTRTGGTDIVARAVSDYTSDFEWDAVEDIHRWLTKSQLMRWSTARFVVPVNERYSMPADHDRYWGLSCGNVKLPG